MNRREPQPTNPLDYASPPVDALPEHRTEIRRFTIKLLTLLIAWAALAGLAIWMLVWLRRR